jgi:Kdo2-lipid IVA lauroyltransferase/acyltransferase
VRALLWRAARRARGVNYWLIAQVAFATLSLLRRLPPDKALNFVDRAARRIGPLSGRHRVALANLRRAYPEKSEREIEAIASDMWANMARLGAEYIYLKTLFDLDRGKIDSDRVELRGAEIFNRLAADPRPHIFFTAHTGNFELLPIAAGHFGLQLTSMFRAPNNPYLAEELFSARDASRGHLLPSQPGAAFTLAGILERGGNIGVLVDQKFSGGLRTTFFGRECQTSPLAPKLARQFDCDIHPARAIRLPGNRFRIELFEKLELPRTPEGKVDVNATAQLLNDVVEGWVREDPGQWMWFHKRWLIRQKWRRGTAVRRRSSS